MARDDNERGRVFAEEEAVVNVQSFLHELMEEKGISRADLARAMGVSRARVTQLFSDECTNLTLRVLARAMFALNEELVVSSSRRLQSNTCDVREARPRPDTPCKPHRTWVLIDDNSQQLFGFGVSDTANDNVFGGLGYLRQERASYGMAA